MDPPSRSSDGKPLVMLSPDPVQDTLNHNRIVARQHCHVVAGEVPVGREIYMVRLHTVWNGMVWYGMVLYRTVWYGMVSTGRDQYGMVWYGTVWYGMVWYGMDQYGVVCYDMAWYFYVLVYMLWYGMVFCGSRYPSCNRLSFPGVGLPVGTITLTSKVSIV